MSQSLADQVISDFLSLFLSLDLFGTFLLSFFPAQRASEKALILAWSHWPWIFFLWQWKPSPSYRSAAVGIRKKCVGRDIHREYQAKKQEAKRPKTIRSRTQFLRAKSSKRMCVFFSISLGSYFENKCFIPELHWELGWSLLYWLILIINSTEHIRIYFYGKTSRRRKHEYVGRKTLIITVWVGLLNFQDKNPPIKCFPFPLFCQKYRLK